MREFKVPVTIAKVMHVSGVGSFSTQIVHGYKYVYPIVTFYSVAPGSIVEHRVNEPDFNEPEVVGELC